MRIQKLNFYQSDNNSSRLQFLQNDRLSSSGFVKYSKGLSVIILNLDRPEFIIPLLNQLQDAKEYFLTKSIPLDIQVGDTGSTHPDVLKYFREHCKKIHVTSQLKYHFSRTNNVLFQNTRNSHVLFLNNDILFSSNVGEQLWGIYNAFCEDSSLGAMGSLLHFENGSIQHAGIDFFRNAELRGFCYHPNGGKRKNDVIQNFQISYVPAVTGAFLMMKSDLFHSLGGFSEDYQTECQDVDLCLLIHRLGFKIGIIHPGKIIHFENGTRKQGEENWKDRQLFLRRWSSYIEASFL